MLEIEDTTVTVMVDDLDRAQSFYTQTLGFAVLYRAGPHFAMVERAGLKLGLHPRAADTAREASSRLSIGFRVSDIREGVAALEGAGVAFAGGIVSDGAGLQRADFTDPDGTALYLIQT